MDKDKVKEMATALNGTPYESGGGIWVIHFTRQDGAYIVIGHDRADVYVSKQHHDDYANGRTILEPKQYCWV